MNLFAIQLIIAHILGDFVLQPDHWVEDKKTKKYQSKYFYFHCVIHFVSLFVLLQFNWKYLHYIILIAVSHLGIDWLKCNLEKQINSSILFILDQVAHLTVIAVVVYFNEPFSIHLEIFYSKEILLLVLSILLVTYVSSITMKIILNNWNIKENSSKNSLKNAGKYIGMLERIFVLRLSFSINGVRLDS